MKAIKIVGHPILVVSLFLLVIIEGVHFGGFYVLYLLFGLTYAAPFALTAVGGIALMVLTLNLSIQKRPVLKPILYVVGWLMLLLSYAMFFNDGKNNHRETFETTVPIISFLLFGISSLCFLINMLQMIVNNNGKIHEELRAV